MIEDLDNIDFITKVMGSSIFESQLEKKDEDISDAIKEAEDVKKREDEKKPVNKTKLFIIIASVIIVIEGTNGAGAFLGWFCGVNDLVEVPDFKGMSLEAAQIVSEKYGLKDEEGDQVYSPDQEEGKITSQTPGKGAKVSKGKVITVNISLGKKDGVVPNIVGMDYKEAKAYLKDFGFELGMVVKVKSTKPENTVITQSVEAGSTADKGTVIDVEVSDGKGKEMKEVPYLIGKDVDTAKSEIIAAGFKVGNIYYEESDEYPKNTITSQQYKSGEELEEGTAIDIVVSKGSSSESEEGGETTPSEG